MPMKPADSEGLDCASSSRAETINGGVRLAGAFRWSTRCPVSVTLRRVLRKLLPCRRRWNAVARGAGAV